MWVSDHPEPQGGCHCGGCEWDHLLHPHLVVLTTPFVSDDPSGDQVTLSGGPRGGRGGLQTEQTGQA